MTDLTAIKPVNTKILFQFVDDISSGTFNTTSKAGIVMVEQEETKIKENRWGKVLATGSGVDADIVAPDQFILIEALGWTTSMTLDDVHDSEKFWFTELEKIMCVAYEKPDTRV